MKNRRALFGALTSVTMLTLAVIACGDDDSSTFQKNNDKPDANFDTGGGFNTDAKNEEKDANVACTPAVPATFAPAFKPAQHQDACEAVQLGDYFTHCLSSDEKGSAKLKSTECSDWKAAAANTVCSHCLETDDNSGPALIFRDRLYYTFNFAGCIGILQKNTAKDSCADAFSAVEQCKQQSCDNCVGKPGVTDDQAFGACPTTALNSDCKTFKTKRDDTCNATGYLDAGSSLSAVDCLATKAGEAAGNVFTRLAKTFCGKP